MRVRAAALCAARENARTAGEILAAESRVAYAKAHDGAECPVDRIPATADLVAALPTCPECIAAAIALAAGALLTASAEFTDATRATQRAAERWLRDFWEPYQPVPDSDWWTLEREGAGDP